MLSRWSKGRLRHCFYWLQAFGIVQTEGVINWTGSKWVENTLDGGFSVWLTDMKRSDGTRKKLKRWARWDLKDGEIVPEGSLLTLSKKAQTPSSNDKLKAECPAEARNSTSLDPMKHRRKFSRHFQT
ncbi:hypothetical protein WAI453_006828 [Rhynchosporium graminicola]